MQLDRKSLMFTCFKQMFLINTWGLLGEQKRLTSLSLSETYQGEPGTIPLAVTHIDNYLYTLENIIFKTHKKQSNKCKLEYDVSQHT